MKKTILLTFLSLISLSLNSCKDDVTGADDNVKKTLLTYNKVLSDQTHNVIMPLKVGNKWIYSYNGDSTKLDSIVVLQELNIQGAKWFRTKMHTLAGGFSDTVKLTNTDSGLWIMCDTCKYDFAPYPVDNSTQLYRLDALYGSKSSQIIDTAYLKYFYTITVNQPVEIFSKKSLGIKYECFYDLEIYINGVLEKLNPGIKGFTRYFIPDSGLIEWSRYNLDLNNNKSNIENFNLIKCEINK